MFVCQLHCTKGIIMVFTFTQLYGLYPNRIQVRSTQTLSERVLSKTHQKR